MIKRVSKTFLLIPIMGFVAFTSVQAEDWTGEGELGYVLISGNTESESLNSALKFEKIQDKWKHTAKLSAIRAEAVDETSNEKELSSRSSSAGWRSQHSLSDRAYTFGDFRYFDDEFDSFEETYTASIGFGYSVFKTEGKTWDVSLGTGYRDTTVEETQEDVSGVNYLIESDFKYRITETTKVDNYTRAELNSNNDFYQNITGLSVSINSSLALKISYEVRYNSNPSSDIESTDRIFSTNIVYKF